MATRSKAGGGASVTSYGPNVFSIATPERSLRTRLRILRNVRMCDAWIDDVAKASIRGELDDDTALEFHRQGWIERCRLATMEAA